MSLSDWVGAGPVGIILTWVHELRTVGSGAGLCVLHSLFQRELRFRRVAAGLIEDFFDNLAGAVHSSPSPLICVSSICSTVAPMQGPIAHVHCKVSRVMTLQALARYTNDPTDRRSLERLRRRIETNRLDWRVLAGEFRGGKKAVWVAPADDCDGFVDPDVLRDKLGKPDWQSGSSLVQLTYASTVAGIYATPTFFDADANPIFRPHKEPDGWGRTVDLNGFGVGLRELLHSSFLLPVHMSFRSIGELKHDRDVDYMGLLRVSRVL